MGALIDDWSQPERLTLDWSQTWGASVHALARARRVALERWRHLGDLYVPSITEKCCSGKAISAKRAYTHVQVMVNVSLNSSVSAALPERGALLPSTSTIVFPRALFAV